MEEKEREEAENRLIPDNKLAEFEESVITDLKKNGVDYNLETLKAFKEGIRFACSAYGNTEKMPFKVTVTLAVAGLSKLIRKKEEFQKQMETSSKE